MVKAREETKCTSLAALGLLSEAVCALCNILVQTKRYSVVKGMMLFLKSEQKRENLRSYNFRI